MNSDKDTAKISALEARLKRAEELIREATSVHFRTEWLKKAQAFLVEGK